MGEIAHRRQVAGTVSHPQEQPVLLTSIGCVVIAGVADKNIIDPVAVEIAGLHLLGHHMGLVRKGGVQACPTGAISVQIQRVEDDRVGLEGRGMAAEDPVVNTVIIGVGDYRGGKAPNPSKDDLLGEKKSSNRLAFEISYMRPNLGTSHMARSHEPLSVGFGAASTDPLGIVKRQLSVG